MNAELPYRPNVCMLITNSARQLFLGQRAGSPDVWQLPQGGVELDQSLTENVLREVHEELGIEPDLVRVVKQLSATHRYDFANPPSYAVGRWRGQEQTFWIVEFVGTDRDIKLDRFDPEFMSYRWCTPQEVRQLAEPKRKPGYQAPLLEFEDWINEG